MNVISVFNNKGGVGKSTLSYHLAHALAELGHKTLMLDMDPQSNLTLQSIAPEELEKMWSEEEPLIDDFSEGLKEVGEDFEEFLSKPRTVHCMLKPIEDGVIEHFRLGEIYKINDMLGLIPGRLSLHTFEDKLSKLWSDAYIGQPQALRTITSIRELCQLACERDKYEYVIIDTSPSLGVLNKVVISMSTGFFVPCMPDMFSKFGISNIGKALRLWIGQYNTMYSLLPEKKRELFPDKLVQFLGYNIYNAKPYQGRNKYDLAVAHYEYAQKLPEVVNLSIPDECKSKDKEVLGEPIGGTAIMHTHNTYPAMTQKYRVPLWKIPEVTRNIPRNEDWQTTVRVNQVRFTETQEKYHDFARALIARL